jgi:hypothetical protein
LNLSKILCITFSHMWQSNVSQQFNILHVSNKTYNLRQKHTTGVYTVYLVHTAVRQGALLYTSVI